MSCHSGCLDHGVRHDGHHHIHDDNFGLHFFCLFNGLGTIGSNVNAGAGTITCNYDGVFKHKTIIEDDVFIGSDTQLIAPVRVGRGATLAAGTTLAKDAPADMLTLSRVTQKSVRWQRPVKKDKA